MRPVNHEVVQELHDSDKFCQNLGSSDNNEKFYHDYLTYFQQEIDKKGYESVINEYLFGDDKRADAMLIRMFAGMIKTGTCQP